MNPARLVEIFGVYGGALAVAFIAGLFPLFSIEIFLAFLAAKLGLSVEALALCSALAAISHQIAKTMTYYAGAGALEHGKMKARLERNRPRIDRWNKAPNLIMTLSATVGIPPLYFLGYIAHPIMRIPFWRFTAIVFLGRIGRFMFFGLVGKQLY